MQATIFNLLIGDEFADIADNTRLSIKRQNKAFAYGDLSLSRTQEFSLPKTPKNNRIFGIASRVETAASNTAAWNRVQAQLQHSAGVINGTIVVNSVGTAYTAVFLYSDMQWLYDATNAGTVRESMPDRDIDTDAVAGSTRSYTAEWDDDTMFYHCRYHNRATQGNSNYSYCAVTSSIIAMAKQLNGYGVEFDASGLPHIGLALNYRGAMPKQTVPVSANLQGMEFASVANFRKQSVSSKYTIGATDYTTSFNAMFVPNGATISIPKDFPDGYVLASPRWQTYDAVFVGGREIYVDETTGETSIIGDTLAGKQIVIDYESSNMPLIIAARSEATVAIVDGKYRFGGFRGTTHTGSASYDLGIEVVDIVNTNSACTLTYGGLAPADMTWLQLINIIRNYSGKRMVVNDGVLSFEDYDFETWDSIKPDVLSISGISRGLATSNSTNGITFGFDYDDYISEDLQLVMTEDFGITIKGDLDEKYKFPASCGTPSSDGIISIDDFPEYEMPYNVEMTAKKPTLVEFGADGKMHVPSPVGFDGNHRADMAAFSAGGWVYMTAKVAMTMSAFATLEDDKLILIDGSLFAWIDGTWTSGTATLTLQRVVF